MRLSRTPLLLTTLLLLAAPALAQGTKDRTVPERVYVPIEDFDKLFSKERGGVFVPYEDLMKLVRRANAQPAPKQDPPPVKPPTDYVLVGATFEGQAGERVVHFTATFDVEVLEPREWVVVPIGLGEASLESVTSTGAQRAVVGPLSLLQRQVARRNRWRGKGRSRPAPSTGGYGILVRGAGRVQTTARFAVPVRSKPGESSFRLKLPGAALTRFRVTLPQKGIKVGVENALATTEASVEGKDQTQVRAYFGAAANAKVVWNPKPKEVAGVKRKPLLFATTETSLWLDAGVVQTRTRIDYQISQAPCGAFRVRFPKGYTLVRVLGNNMDAEPQARSVRGAQEFTVRLHDPVDGKYSLDVRLMRNLGEDVAQLDVPRVETVGTGRESGVLMARASEFISMEPLRLQGLTQIDVGGLTPRLLGEWKKVWLAARRVRKKIRPPLVFRYLRQPFALRLKTSKIEPEVEGKVYTLALVRDDEVGLRTSILYSVRKRGIFSVKVRVPEKFVLDPASIDERTVKDHRVEEGVLHIDFVNQRNPGSFWLTFRGTVNRPKQPDAGEVPLELPRFHLLGVKEEKGVLGVGGEKHLKLMLKKNPRLLETPVRELYGDHKFPHRVQDGRKEELTFGFKYSKPQGVAASFTVKKKEPKVTAKVETLVDAQEDLVKVKSTIRYKVEYAGVERLRIEAPQALKTDKDLKFDGEAIKDKQVAIDGGKAVWTLSLQGKRTGDFAITAEYDIKLTDFQAGQQKPVTLHELKILDCFSETGDIALKKHENLVISEKTMTMLEKRDKRELPEPLKKQGPIQAYRYVSHPHELTLNVTKYDFQAPLGILVKHMHLDEVLQKDGLLKAEAFLALQNNAEQFLTVLLPPGATMRGLKVDGKNEEWSEGAAIEGRPSVQVHLGEVTKARRQTPFLIRLRYDIPSEEKLGGSGNQAFHTLEFPLKGGQQVPVARLTRSVYLPEGYAFLEFATDATKHFDESSLWESLKRALGIRTGREREVHGASTATSKIHALKTMTPGRAASGLYPDLEVPQGRAPYLFEKLDNPSRLSVRFMNWGMFFLLDVVIFLAIVVLGVVLDLRKLVGPVVFVSVAAALAVLGGTFLGQAVEPYFASALAGSLGLGGFFLGRGVWRELTVLRHERRLSELAKEAEVAKARADAAEREASLRGAVRATERTGTDRTPRGTGAKAKPKAKAAPTAEEQQAADKIKLVDEAPQATDKTEEVKPAEPKSESKPEAKDEDKKDA